MSMCKLITIFIFVLLVISISVSIQTRLSSYIINVSPWNENSVMIYSLSCCFFLLQSTIEEYWLLCLFHSVIMELSSLKKRTLTHRKSIINTIFWSHPWANDWFELDVFNKSNGFRRLNRPYGPLLWYFNYAFVTVFKDWELHSL